MLDEWPEASNQCFPWRQVFFQSHPRARPIVQITAVAGSTGGRQRTSSAVYFASLRFENRSYHGTDHHSKPLPSPSGICLPTRSLWSRQEKHRSRPPAGGGLGGGLLGVPPAGIGLRSSSPRVRSGARTECKALWALRPSPRSPCCAMQPTWQRHDGKPYSSLRRLPPQVHEAWKQKPINLEDLRQAEPEPELRRVKRRKGPLALVNSENLPVKTYVYELSSEERVCPGCVVERKEVGSMSARSMRAPIVSGREKIRRSTKGRGLVESLICYHFDMGMSEILCCLPGFTVRLHARGNLGVQNDHG